jgi:DNA-binding SARP family transcriptional activator
VKTSDGLRVEVLGPLRAWRNATEIPLGPPRQRAVFAALAMRAGRQVTRAELVTAVWGDTPPASAEGNLHTYVSRLRRALDPGRAHRSSASLLVSDAAGYTIRVQPSDVDVTVFEQACADAVRDAAAENFASIVESLDAALGLWRGDALSGVPGPLAEAERERLAQLRLTAVERRAAAVLALGGHRELCAELAGLAGEHPVRESLRELLMLALYRSGRHTEALEVFRDARRVLVRELGIEPGERLRRLHEQVLAFDPDLDLPAVPARRPGGFVSAPPAQAGRAVEQDAAGSFVGRAGEVGRLRELVAAVAGGRGGVVWVEGEPGIGKTDLLAVSLSRAGADGCQVAWGTCHEIGSRFPLDVLRTCLGAAPGVADPDQADDEAAGLVPGDPVLAAADRLLSLVDELCAKAPLVLVVDNLQWVDEVSLRVLRGLTMASRRLPLLLVLACRPVSDDVALLRLRDRTNVGGGVFLRLSPLSDVDTATLVGRTVGARPGPRLTELVARAAGNPFYVREILHVLREDGAITRTGEVADVTDSAEVVTLLPLLDAVDSRLGYLSVQTRTMLNWAALLGVEFTAADVATVMDLRAAELVRAIEEAVDANILIDAGAHLEFRHSLVHEVFYGRVRGTARTVLHERAAQALADADAPVQLVAQQLAAMSSTTPQWTAEWLADHCGVLSHRAPLIAADLLRRAVDHTARDTALRQALLVALVRVLFRLERDAEDLAREALDGATDAAQAADVREMLATMLNRRGDTAGAVALLEPWSADPAVPESRRTRHRQLLATLRRGDLDDLPATERGARAELARGGDDGYLTAHARQTLWLVATVRRDHQQALAHVDRAIGEVRGRAGLAGKHLDLLENRMFTLASLDALAEAGRTLAAARAVAGDHALPAGLRLAAAVHHYWTGQWEDALVELDLLTGDGPAEPGAAVLLPHGVAALIAARRDDEGQAAAHLAAAEHPPAGDRDRVDFLLAARSTMAERGGDLEGALRELVPLLDPGHGRPWPGYQWLPRFIRLAMALGHRDLADRAMVVCAEEAAREVPPARAFAAAEWGRGLVLRDSARVLRAAEHYRKVSRRMELATALEDAAVLLAEAGATAAAAAALTESLEIYTELAAGWDVRRAENRLAALGVSRATRPAEPRPDAGWESLSPGEVRTATLAATGRGAPAAAGPADRPGRNIQTHVASVLRKLDGGGEAPDEVRRHVEDS